MKHDTTKRTLNPKSILCAAALALALASSLPLSAADGGVRYQARPSGSRVEIQGTSTVHDWTMDGAIIGGWVEFASGVKVDHTQAAIEGLKDGKVPAKAESRIPVRQIKSHYKMGEVMDGLYEEALKEKQFPNILYVLKEMTPKPNHVPGKPFELDCKGDLAIAGKTNTVSFPITLERTAMDMIKIKGTAPLKMTAFGITPPAPNIGLGLMKCGDDVKIVFEWSLVEKKQ